MVVFQCPACGKTEGLHPDDTPTLASGSTVTCPGCDGLYEMRFWPVAGDA